jgi:hypothetical protein|tara:strand:- start:150 stop:332 length:183 start_codon:yes stop_codon:yes gene_type:complete
MSHIFWAVLFTSRRTLMSNNKNKSDSERWMLWYEFIEKLIDLYQYCDEHGVIDIIMSFFM